VDITHAGITQFTSYKKATIKEHFHYGVALRCFVALHSALQRYNALCSALSR